MKKLFFLVAFFYALLNTTYAQTITGGTSFLSATQIPTFNEIYTMGKDTTDKYLKFDLQQGEGVTLAFTGHMNSGSMSMYMYTPENQSSYFSSTYVYDGDTKTMSFTAQSAGVYYIKITGNPGLLDVVAYQSFYTPGVSDASRDFYSSFDTAKYLTEGNHNLNSLGFSNYYRFEAQVGDTVSISATGHLSSGSVTMYAYTPGNQSSSFDSLYLYDGDTKTMSFTAQTSGTYYIRVSANLGSIDFVLNGVRADIDTDNDGLSNSVEHLRGTDIESSDTNGNGISDYSEAIAGNIGKYITEWTLTDMSSANSISAAKEIPYFNQSFSFDKDTTDKYLKFDLQEGEGVTVLFTGHMNSGSMSMYMYTPENQSSYFSSMYVYDGDAKTKSFTAASSGTYYLKITGNAGLADIAVYQSFTTPGVSDASRDFYSSFNTAKYLSEGNHNLNNMDLSNYYRFDAQVGDNITIDITAHVASGSVTMYAYTPENQSSSFDSLYLYDGDTKTMSFTAYSAGIFYIRVSDSEGNIDLVLSGIRPDTDGDNILDENDPDDDNDGMPDTFEDTYGLDSKDPSDRDTDLDDDGVSNYDEYRAGTNPEDPNDYLGTPLANPAVIMFLLG